MVGVCGNLQYRARSRVKSRVAACPGKIDVTFHHLNLHITCICRRSRDSLGRSSLPNSRHSGFLLSLLMRFQNDRLSRLGKIMRRALFRNQCRYNGTCQIEHSASLLVRFLVIEENRINGA